MKACLSIIFLLVACAPKPVGPEGRAERRPEIGEAVKELDAPVTRIDKANVRLVQRVAVMERERDLLKRESAEWEDEMARWQERGLTAEQMIVDADAQAGVSGPVADPIWPNADGHYQVKEADFSAFPNYG